MVRVMLNNVGLIPGVSHHVLLCRPIDECFNSFVGNPGGMFIKFNSRDARFTLTSVKLNGL